MVCGPIVGALFTALGNDEDAILSGNERKRAKKRVLTRVIEAIIRWELVMIL